MIVLKSYFFKKKFKNIINNKSAHYCLIEPSENTHKTFALLSNRNSPFFTNFFKATKPAELDCEIFMPLLDKNLVPFNDSSSVMLTNALAVFESE